MSREYCTQQVFQDIGSCSTVSLAMATNQTPNTSKTVYLPANANTTLTGTDTTDTLTNKTINGASIYQSTLTQCTITDQPNYEGQDLLFVLKDYGTGLKRAKFECGSITDNTTRTMTFPNADTTLVGTGVAQTLTNKTMADASNTFTYSVSTCTATDWTTPIASKSYTFYAVKLGYAVYLHFPINSSTTSGAAAVFTKAGIVPSGYRPPQQVEFIVNVQNSTFTTGLLVITSSGDVTIYATLAGGNFTTGGVNCRIGNWCVSYTNSIS